MYIDISHVKSPFPVHYLNSAFQPFASNIAQPEAFSQVLQDEVVKQEQETLKNKKSKRDGQRLMASQLMDDSQLHRQDGQRFLSGQLSHIIPIDNTDVQQLAQRRQVEGLQLSSQGQGKSFQDGGHTPKG